MLQCFNSLAVHYQIVKLNIRMSSYLSDEADFIVEACVRLSRFVGGRSSDTEDALRFVLAIKLLGGEFIAESGDGVANLWE